MVISPELDTASVPEPECVRDWLAADNVIVPLVDTAAIVVVWVNVVPVPETVAMAVPPTSRMWP